jgi:hypothetical protein
VDLIVLDRVANAKNVAQRALNAVIGGGGKPAYFFNFVVELHDH